MCAIVKSKLDRSLWTPTILGAKRWGGEDCIRNRIVDVACDPGTNPFNGCSGNCAGNSGTGRLLDWLWLDYSVLAKGPSRKSRRGTGDHGISGKVECVFRRGLAGSSGACC